MKTQRRHELQTNVLADRMARTIETIRPYSRLIGGLAVVVVALAMALGYGVYAARAKRARDWREYFQAITSPDIEKRLTQISSGDMDESLKHWAQLRLAQDQLREGLQSMLQDRRASQERVKQSADLFAKINNESSDSDVKQMALYGLAQAHEGANELDAAQREYKLLAETWHDGPYHEIASQRAKELETKTTQEFYSWLERYVPPAPARMPDATGLRPNLDGTAPPTPSTLQSPLGQDPFNVGGSFNPTTDLSTTPPDKSAEPAPESAPADEKKDDDKKDDSTDKTPASGPVLPAPAPGK